MEGASPACSTSRKARRNVGDRAIAILNCGSSDRMNRPIAAPAAQYSWAIFPTFRRAPLVLHAGLAPAIATAIKNSLSLMRMNYVLHFLFGVDKSF